MNRREEKTFWMSTKKALTQNESNYKTKAILSNALILFGNIAPLPISIGVRLWCTCTHIYSINCCRHRHRCWLCIMQFCVSYFSVIYTLKYSTHRSRIVRIVEKNHQIWFTFNYKNLITHPDWDFAFAECN